MGAELRLAAAAVLSFVTEIAAGGGQGMAGGVLGRATRHMSGHTSEQLFQHTLVGSITGVVTRVIFQHIKHLCCIKQISKSATGLQVSCRARIRACVKPGPC